MDIYIPNSAYLGNIDPFLLGFNPQRPESLNVRANPKWISVHPVVLSMIAALGLTVDKANIHFETFEAKSKHYLTRMGLFKILGIKSQDEIKEREAAGRFVPLTQIKNSDELSQFITEMTPLLHLEPEHAQPICYITSELVRNVLEHSASKHGAIVSAQYHAKSNTIRIGIVDTGIGIWKSINQTHSPQNKLEALQMALSPGLTGSTTSVGGTEYNAGAGLFFIKSIACVNRDFFLLYSGETSYKLLRRTGKRIKLQIDPFKDRHSKRNDLPYWQGTVVGIDISLDTHQDFPRLLDLISDAYAEAMELRRKARYRSPKFI